MSQRECAGFNWPPLSVPAQEPVSISPEAVKRAGVASLACIAALKNPFFAARRSTASSVQSVLSPSAANGVLHAANRTTSFSGRALCVSSFPGSIAPLWPRACGLGQPARCVATAVSVSALPRPQRIPLLSPSSKRGVGHPP